MIVTWSGKLFTLRVSRYDFDVSRRHWMRKRVRPQGKDRMGRRGRAGDPDHGFCRGLLFQPAAWIVYHLQIRNAAARSDFVLQNDTGHHDPERGCPVRLGYRSVDAADFGEL